MLQHEPGPVTPCSEAFRPASAPLHASPGSLYLALEPSAGLRVGNPGSVEDGQVLLLVKFLASPLGACNGAHKETVQGHSKFPLGGQWLPGVLAACSAISPWKGVFKSSSQTL